jgi:hypothetical protein
MLVVLVKTAADVVAAACLQVWAPAARAVLGRFGRAPQQHFQWCLMRAVCSVHAALQDGRRIAEVTGHGRRQQSLLSQQP